MTPPATPSPEPERWVCTLASRWGLFSAEPCPPPCTGSDDTHGAPCGPASPEVPLPVEGSGPAPGEAESLIPTGTDMEFRLALIHIHDLLMGTADRGGAATFVLNAGLGTPEARARLQAVIDEADQSCVQFEGRTCPSDGCDYGCANEPQVDLDGRPIGWPPAPGEGTGRLPELADWLATCAADLLAYVEAGHRISHADPVGDRCLTDCTEAWYVERDSLRKAIADVRAITNGDHR